MTKKEDKKRTRQEREDQENRFPMALGTCPVCGSCIRFPAGVAEVECKCGKDGITITVYREGKNV